MSLDVQDRIASLSLPANTPGEIAARNQSAIDLVRDGWIIDKETLLNAYLGRGPVLELEGDRGIIDSHKRRAEHLGQFLTPLPVTRFIQQMLGIDQAPSPVVADLSGCGSGRMFWGLQPTAHLIGVELDTDALAIAKAVYPKANLVQDTLANRDDRGIADYVIGNPPFSDWLTQRDLPYENARWGALGPRSSIRSDIAAVELAFKAVKPLGFVAMVWPDEINDGYGDPMERSGDIHTQSLAKWLKEKGSPLFRIHLGSQVFKPSGTEWRTVVLGWRASLNSSYRSIWKWSLFERFAETIDDLPSILAEWRQSDAYNGYQWDSGILGYARGRKFTERPIIVVTPEKVEEQALPELLTVQLPPDVVYVGVDEASDSLTLTHDGGLASAMRLREWQNSWGKVRLSHNEDTEKKGWQYVLRARNFYGAPLSTSKYGRTFPDSTETLTRDLLDYGLHAEFTVEAWEYLVKRCEWLKLHTTPLEHMVPTRDMILMYLDRHGHRSEFARPGGKDAWGNPARIKLTNEDIDEWFDLPEEDRDNYPLNEWIRALIASACTAAGVVEVKALTSEWVERNELNGLRTVYAAEYAERVQLVRTLAGIFNLPPKPFELFPYQIDDVARYSLREHNICYAEQATGKAMMLTLLALVYKTLDPMLKSLIVTESRLMDEFGKASFGFQSLQGRMRKLDKPSDLQDKNVWIWITSYDQIWRKPKGSDKTWAELLLDYGIGFLACDEAQTLSAKLTQRSVAIRDFAKQIPKRIGASGTMIPNVPRNAVGTWTTFFGDATALNEWGYEWPIIEGFSPEQDGTTHLYGTSQTRTFGKKFVTVEWLTPEFSQTLSQGMHGREMPALKGESLEEWQKWMSTTVIRRLTAEPGVAPFAKILDPEIIEHTMTPTIHHAAIIDHYTKAAFEAMVDEQEKKKPCILPILINVLFAGTVPQSPKISHDFIRYSEGLTTKQTLAVELVLQEIALGKKVMLSSERPEFCVLMHNYFLKEYGIKGHVFTGKQSIDDRNRILVEMEANPESQIMFATIQTGGVGLNLPFIGSIVNTDYGWKDASVAQLARRICRPAFQSYYPGLTPTVHLLALEGSLDPYQRQVCRTKFSAKAEAIDHRYQTEEEVFETWSDMIFRFFRDQGYDLASALSSLKAA